MSQPIDQLVVRQHERYHCRLEAEARVSPDNRGRLTLSRAAGNGTGTVAAVMVDCSVGGIGLETDVYFPRGCRLEIRAALPGPTKPEFRAVVQVQRASMISRAPRYYLGLSFTRSGAEHDSQVAALIAAVCASADDSPIRNRRGGEAAA